MTKDCGLSLIPSRSRGPYMDILGEPMKEEWKKCILSYIDIIGVKALAKDSRGSSIMRSLQCCVTDGFEKHLLRHDHAYVWNDSVLVIAFLKNEPGEKMRLLREVNDFKRHLDKTLDMRSFAVVVEGRIFPANEYLPGPELNGADSSKVTVLKTSSWAMANCFEIERELRRLKLKKNWYIDSRVTKGLRRPSREDMQVTLLPANRKRALSMYDDYLW